MGSGAQAPLAYIIGFPDKFRGVNLGRQLEESGFVVELSHGVVGPSEPKDIESVVDVRGSRKLLRRNLTSGEIGCALAHRSVYTKFLLTTNSWCLVFEDDAQLTNEFDLEAILSVIASNQPRIVQLDSGPNCTVLLPSSTKMFGKNQILFSQAVVPPTRANAYALNRHTAQLLLDATEKISHVADWPVRVNSRVEFYVPIRKMANLTDVVSQIGDRSNLHEGIKDRCIRLVSVVLHFRWMFSHHLYGSYRSYLMHEFVRMSLWSNSKKIITKREQEHKQAPVYVSAIWERFLRFISTRSTT